MDFFCDILLDSLRTSVLVCGLVIIMMMLIELINVDSRGKLFSGLKTSKFGQVLLSATLGVIPGCMGGFATVSLYTHGIISFGSLVAMMIVSSGDEAFVMLALFPDKAMWMFALLFAIGVATGMVVDLFYHPARPCDNCCGGLEVHKEDSGPATAGKHFGWKRVVMFLGVAIFITALLAGWLEHEEGITAEGESESFMANLLSEEWMYWMFGILSLAVLAVLVAGSDHFVEEHLWNHIVRKHVPSVFLWTFGVLVFTGLALHYCDIASWISSNTALMIILAALIGIIPESGPHLVFVTLFASGVLPVEVLLTSCISQDGHASLPLLAGSKSDFLKAKAINFAVASAVGFTVMFLV